MIVREPFEIAYQHDQAQRESAEDQMAECWGFDALALQEIVKRWGIKTVLTEIATIHEQLSTDGSKVLWSVPSQAYLSGGYDSPNPCSCDEF
jgi:alpha-mannosidase